MEKEQAIRQLSDVLAAIIDEIPNAEIYLRQQLESVRQSAVYAPPESQAIWWHKASRVLGDRVAELMGGSTPFPEWPEKTRRIFAGEDLERVDG